MKFSVLILFLLLLVSALSAQNEEETRVEDISEEAKPNEEGLNRIFNTDKAPVETLKQGGAFYVSNPPPLIELDPKLAYYRTEWETLVIRLVTGNTTELTGRYRLLDQKFEIQTDDGIYEIYSTMVAEARLGEDYFIVQSKDGEAQINQIYFRGTAYMLLGEHTAELQDAPKQNMFDTSDAKRTLKRRRSLYLRYADGVKVELKNKKQTMTILRIYKGSEEADFIKKKKLDLKEPADLVKLMKFLEENNG